MGSPIEHPVLIRGAGDLASGIAARLHRCGFPVAMTELSQPLLVRRKVCFGEAVYEGETTVEDIRARRVPDVPAALEALAEGSIAVLVDPEAVCRRALAPTVLVDAMMAKHNTGTSRADAPLVIGVGPGFTAGIDCHVVIETQRGHWLGRVIRRGTASADTGVPGEVSGQREARVLRAPVGGVFEACAQICDYVVIGQIVGHVAGVEMRAGCDGILRGLVHPGVTVAAGMKIGDIDPRAEPAACLTISDKSLSVAGGVLEAILASGVIGLAFL